MICAKCPAYYPTHTPENGERQGVCRFEPPRVYRRFVKIKDTVTGAEEDHIVYDSAYPPTTDLKWCIRGRMLMELRDQTPKSWLTDPAQRGNPDERLVHGGLDV